MPKTLTLDVRTSFLVREALVAKRKLLERSLDGKRDRWAREQLEMLDAVFEQLNKPVMVERTNLMTGEKYMEEEGTPNFCSPSSETYWSM